MPRTADQPVILLSPPDLRGGERKVLAAIDSGWIAPVGPDLVARIEPRT